MQLSSFIQDDLDERFIHDDLDGGVRARIPPTLQSLFSFIVSL
jgi:hypothetical protein